MGKGVKVGNPKKVSLRAPLQAPLCQLRPLPIHQPEPPFFVWLAFRTALSLPYWFTRCLCRVRLFFREFTSPTPHDFPYYSTHNIGVLSMFLSAFCHVFLYLHTLQPLLTTDLSTSQPCAPFSPGVQWGAQSATLAHLVSSLWSPFPLGLLT